MAQQVAKLEAQASTYNTPGHTKLAVTPRTVGTLLTFVYSQYANAYGVDVQKHYTDIDHPTIHDGDHIQVTITINNTSSGKDLSNILYLDGNTSKVFRPSGSNQYTLIQNGQSSTGTLNDLGSSEKFDNFFGPLSLASNSSLQIQYNLIANSVTYGKMAVGFLEPGAKLGEISLMPKAQVGGQTIIWRPNANGEYKQTLAAATRSTKSLASTLGKEGKLLADSSSTDPTNSGVTIPSDPNAPVTSSNLSSLQSYAQGTLDEITQDTGNLGIPDSARDVGSQLFTFSPSQGIQGTGMGVDNLSSIASSITSGGGAGGLLSGIGDSSSLGDDDMQCTDLPLNYAPLSP